MHNFFNTKNKDPTLNMFYFIIYIFRDIQNDKDDFNKQMVLAEFLTLILSVGETLPLSCFG